jgi:hypothetical protein
MVKNWYKTSPHKFRVTAKFHKIITHDKRGGSGPIISRPLKMNGSGLQLLQQIIIMLVLGLGLRIYLGICWGCQKLSGRIRDETRNKKKVLRMTWT